jgi:hypothetical protein
LTTYVGQSFPRKAAARLGSGVVFQQSTEAGTQSIEPPLNIAQFAE